jgi:hypothetical protein
MALTHELKGETGTAAPSANEAINKHNFEGRNERTKMRDYGMSTTIIEMNHVNDRSHTSWPFFVPSIAYVVSQLVSI